MKQLYSKRGILMKKRILSLLVILTIIFTMVTPITASASSYREWKQYAGEWAAYKMGNGSATVKKYGCTSTALAIAAVRLGCESESSFNPGTFVTRMNNCAGYTSGGGIYWNKISTAVPNMSMVGSEIKFSSESNQSRIDKIGSYLDKGYAVLITIKRAENKWHYVLADSVSGSTLNILDPGGNNGNITNKYGNAQIMIRSIRVFKNNNKVGYSGDVTPPDPVHTHSYHMITESNHPHSQYNVCSCGSKIFVRNVQSVNCSSCYPLGNIKLTRSFEKTKGTAIFYRNNVSNATNYTLELYKNGFRYNTYTMSDDSYSVTGLPSGNYSATLIAKNENTGESKNTSCISFSIVNTYTVSYNANGGSNAPEAQTKIQDTTLTLSNVVPIKKGHIFKGWASSKTATEPQYQKGGSYTKNAKITLYAVWEPEAYTVHFDTNGGKGTVEDILVTYGDTIKMPNTIVRDGYYLKGWSKSKSTSVSDYKLGIDYKIEENSTLYAVWGQSTWSGDVATNFAGGDGTEENPYQISNAGELAYLANLVNTQTEIPEYKYYKLTDNINLSYTEWIPIGIRNDANQSFHGSFDGNGFTISNFMVSESNEGVIGLFGHVQNSKIKNLTITGSIENVTASGVISAGAIVGYAQATDIDNCVASYVNVSNISTGNADWSTAGCIAGKIEEGNISGCTANNCYIYLKSGKYESGIICGLAYGNISDCSVVSPEDEIFGTGIEIEDLHIGGLCGRIVGNVSKCTVNTAYFSCTMNTSISAYIGGLIGCLDGNASLCTVKFKNGLSKSIDGGMYNTSIYTSGTGLIRTGGTIGYVSDCSKVSDCIYDGQSISAISESGGTASLGGLIGELVPKTQPTIGVTGGQSLNYLELPKKDGYKATWYTDSGFKTPYDFSQTVTSDLTLFAKWEEGDDTIDIWDGTSKEPAYNETTKTYTVTNGEELAWVSDVTRGVITSGTNFPTDISFSGYTIELANDIYLNDTTDRENWYNNSQVNSWKPIADFKGLFTGDNNDIYGIKASSAGLIRYNYGTIEYLNIKDSIVTVTGTAGAIAAYNRGNINYCSNYGKISSISEGFTYVGGICGYSWGDISYCYNKGEISSNNSDTGGITGGGAGIIIKGCYNTGSVTSLNCNAGGIYGGSGGNSMDVSILYCHNGGTITSLHNYAGGIAGWLQRSNYIYGCYNVGEIKGYSSSIDYSGGIVGYITYSSVSYYVSINYCYGLKYNLYGQKSSTADNINTKNSEAPVYGSQLKSKVGNGLSTTFWGINSDINNGYPYLKSIEETYKTYTITAVDDLDNSTTVDRCFANIDGIVYGSSDSTACAGGVIGMDYVSSVNAFTSAKNLLAYANKISSVSSNSSKKAESGDIIGWNYDNLVEFDNVSSYSSMELSAKNSANSENAYINQIGVPKTLSQIKRQSFLNTVFGPDAYKSIAYLQENDRAVWVINDGELPELYYNVLNDITVSSNIENGSISTDKTQAVNGEIVSVSTLPDEGYVLNKIYVNGEEIVGSTFEVSGNADIYATFAEQTPEFRIEVKADENVSATLRNADEAMLMTFSGTSDNSTNTLTAKDGTEIQVNTVANNDYTVDAIYVNGEEVTGTSFIVTENAVVTMEVANTDTTVEAVTNDATNIGSYEVTLSGSIGGNDDSASRYIRYWEADNPDIVYTTEIVAGSGEYSVDIAMLKPATTYQYQMTEFGDIKSFTTEEEQIAELENSEDTDMQQPLTSTTCQIFTSIYKFTIKYKETMTNETIVIALYEASGKLIKFNAIECYGDTSYSVTIPFTEPAAYAKIFTWNNLKEMKPLGVAEIIEISE